jgi:hypothetical protein
MPRQQARPRDGAQTEASDGEPRVAGESRPPRRRRIQPPAGLYSFSCYNVAMRVKPWLMTGAVAVTGAAALGIVVVGQGPGTAEPALRALVWASLALTAWGILTTLLLAARLPFPQAVGAGTALTIGAFIALLVWRGGTHDVRLLAAILSATLVVSVSVSWRLRAPHAHG